VRRATLTDSKEQRVIADGKQVKVTGGTAELPKLDRFTGPRSIRPEEGGVIYSTAEYAQEEHVDSYLLALSVPLGRIMKFCGGEEAMYLVLNAKGRHGEVRDRIEAAKEVACHASDQIKLKCLSRHLGIYLDHDGLKDGVMGAWVWLDACFTGVFVETCGGQMYLGTGDGYHRQGGYELLRDGPVEPDEAVEEEDAWQCHKVWYGVYPLVVPMDCQTALLKACSLALSNPEEWADPCDEKYGRQYENVRRMLRKRVKGRNPRVTESIERHRMVLAT
jgi:hypothetical protein